VQVFMTHPTKTIYKLILLDFLKVAAVPCRARRHCQPGMRRVQVSNLSPDDQNYDERDMENSMDKIETLDYHQAKPSIAAAVSPVPAYPARRAPRPWSSQE
jgi:cleavage and polyadenylation specificity factor subunit 3